MTTPELPQPLYTKYLTTTKEARTFALIYGPPVAGKSTGARTFPNPIHIDIDNNLPAGTPNVIPMWSDKFVDSVCARVPNAPGNPVSPANRRDALLIVLADLAKTAPAGHTIILDSLTRVETHYNLQEEAEPKLRAKSGEVDGHAMFRRRLTYFDTLCTMFTACAANVVFIVHQQQERNDKGEVIGALKPFLMGQIGEKLPGYFPVLLQALRQKNKTDPAKVDFVWRIRPGINEPARVPKPTTVDFIPQNYTELVKYL